MQSSTMINRKYTVNNAYFDQIDTPEKAYWLGFLWADGNISRTTARASGPNRLRLAQKWDELNHIKRFRAAISSTNPITPVYHADNGCTVAQLDINCRPLCQSLETYGFDIKSKRIHIPDIKPELIHHFIRGYFDGDGCLSIYDQKRKQWITHRQELSMTGNAEFLTEIQAVLTDKANMTSTTKLKTYKQSPNTASLRYGKKSDIICFHDYIYRDATVYLNSKYQKFVDFFSYHAS